MNRRQGRSQIARRDRAEDGRQGAPKTPRADMAEVIRDLEGSPRQDPSSEPDLECRGTSDPPRTERDRLARLSIRKPRCESRLGVLAGCAALSLLVLVLTGWWLCRDRVPEPWLASSRLLIFIIDGFSARRRSFRD